MVYNFTYNMSGPKTKYKNPKIRKLNEIRRVLILEMEEASGDKAKIRNRTNEIEDSGTEPNDENGDWAPRKRMKRRSTTLVETERVYRYLPVSHLSFTSVRSSIVAFFFL